VNDSVNDSVSDPVNDSVSDPVNDSVSDPVNDSVSDPVNDSVSDPVSDPAPVAEDQHQLDGTAPRARRLPRWLVLGVAGGCAVGICLALLVLALVGSDVPRGTRSVGVDIGGRSQTAAATHLSARLSPKLTAPINARVGGETFRIDPRAAGVRLDASATAKVAVTRNPFLRAAALLGRRDVPPVVRVDELRLAPVLAAQDARFGQPPERGAVRFDGTTPVPVYPKAGRGLDPARTAAAVKDAWLRRDPIRLTVSTVIPRATAADVDKAVEEIARPAMAAPVLVRVASRTAVVPPSAIAGALVLSADAAGTITPRFDSRRLDASLTEALRPVNVVPRDAAFKIVGAAVQIVPAVPGRKVDTAALAVDLVAVLTKPAPRTVTGELIGNVAPKLTTARAATLGVKEKISTFTTHHPCCVSRVRNIHLVADEVDGALVMPGETFSLNNHTGPRTAAQGYVEAPVINDGKLKNEIGGGISQFATTTFNAVFFAGLKDVYHQPHSFYISRYPAGREATVYAPNVDLKFANDSPYAVLIDTSYTSTSITVSFWSTKRYEIASVSGPRTNVTTYQTQYLGDTPDCIAASGVNGFDITVTRVFKQAGRVIRNEVFRTRYQPENEVICSDPPPGG